jgi:hypothetical protein
MSGSLAQLIALISYGNAFLINTNPTELSMQNSTLKFCNSIVFNTDQHDKSAVILNGIPKWFVYLKHSGCKRLKVCFKHSVGNKQPSDRETAGFVGGGGNWMIEAVYDNYSDYWQGKEQVTNDNAKDNRIWGVYYNLISKHQIHSKTTLPFSSAKQNLSNTLKNITAFAAKYDFKYWVETFKNASKNLDSANPTVAYYTDFIPPKSYTLTSRQLLFAASNAWVFGGMGSWNDTMFDDINEEKLYNDLSNRLYDDAIEAIIASVNF